MNRRLLPAVTLVLLGAAVAAAAAPKPDPALQVRNPKLKVQWASADSRPAPFDRVALAPIELQFRPVDPMAGPSGYSGNRTEFPVTEEAQADIAKDFNRILREELAGSTKVKLVDEPGPGTLLIKPSLRDIVSRIPPEEPVGRSYVYADSVGDATLVLDFVDPATGQTLGTAMDRRTAEPGGSVASFGGVRANEVGAGQEVRRLARRWGMSLRNRVEQLYFEAKPR